MVPCWAPPPGPMPPAPRTRGDVPAVTPNAAEVLVCSPHPRGWSPGSRADTAQWCLLPAPAGMVPRPAWRTRPPSSAPRTRGDGPAAATPPTPRSTCSPHPRGWTPLRRRAPAGDGLLPVPAGMDPHDLDWLLKGFPAPRTRGDGPGSHRTRPTSAECSPHPRGWTRHRRHRGNPGRLLPAPAGMVPLRPARTRPATVAPCTLGMVPSRSGWPSATSAASRTFGDGPTQLEVLVAVLDCSPPPRG